VRSEAYFKFLCGARIYNMQDFFESLLLQTSCLHLQLPKSEDLEPKLNLCFLAINTGQSTSISITYILFLTKLQKRQTLRNGFAFLISDNTMFLKLCRALINCSYLYK